MVVKYYGFGDRRWGTAQRNAVINTFMRQTVERLYETVVQLDASACIWLVPGTFDLEGRHVE